MSSLGLSIPLYDEEDCCEAVVEELLSALRAGRVACTLALVNNGSRDGTAAILNRLSLRHDNVRALHLEQNAGYGGGILTGLRSLRTPTLGWLWGDGQVEPAVVVEAYRKLRAEDLDLVKARRVRREDGWQRLVVTKAYNAVMDLGFGLGSDDINGCPKLLTRRAYDRLGLSSTDWFLDPECMLKAEELGLRWGEVDAVMHPRAGGSSKVKGETVIEFAHHLRAWRRGWRPGRGG
ncbi:MAG: glycosyltransferase family 2 protein [Alphaproteobacteria bacterium]|nr:glycosyltransferase family 2 protein [Alphaproteobacteria bacterium]MCB9796364.1 glycosyltransferase family 2 protein [Alphaproteobacteria bacterium]